jgi:phospholipase C
MQSSGQLTAAGAFRTLACAFVLLLGFSQPLPPATAQAHGDGTIAHIVVIVQENRTPDNLFQGLPGADIASSGTNSMGKTVTLVPRILADRYDLDHSHAGFLTEYNGGRMNGWDNEKYTCPSKCLPETAFAYVPRAQVQPYFTMAETYTFADRTFQDNQGPSFPAHQFIIAGTSEPATKGNVLVAENLAYHGGTWQTGANCGGSPQDRVMTIDPVTGVENIKVKPCFEHPTIMDLLDAKRVSWRYYNAVSGGYWSAPDAIRHLRFGPDWKNVIVPETTIKSDIAAGNLPAVSWVTPTALESDHASSNNGSGPAYVASIVNAIGQSTYWNSTAIFITWDDWGGWFDHVKPVMYDRYEVGFRVPLIVVSPYAKKGYVSHVQHQQSSILHFIESTFTLGTLGHADLRADDLSDCFNFLQPPTPFTVVATPGWSAKTLARSAGPSNVPPDDDF